MAKASITWPLVTPIRGGLLFSSNAYTPKGIPRWPWYFNGFAPKCPKSLKMTKNPRFWPKCDFQPIRITKRRWKPHLEDRSGFFWESVPGYWGERGGDFKPPHSNVLATPPLLLHQVGLLRCAFIYEIISTTAGHVTLGNVTGLRCKFTITEEGIGVDVLNGHAPYSVTFQKRRNFQVDRNMGGGEFFSGAKI